MPVLRICASTIEKIHVAEALAPHSLIVRAVQNTP
jgi:hypothetical protein